MSSQTVFELAVDRLMLDPNRPDTQVDLAGRIVSLAREHWPNPQRRSDELARAVGLCLRAWAAIVERTGTDIVVQNPDVAAAFSRASSVLYDGSSFQDSLTAEFPQDDRDPTDLAPGGGRL
jgi:hypothetical protein